MEGKTEPINLLPSNIEQKKIEIKTEPSELEMEEGENQEKITKNDTVKSYEKKGKLKILKYSCEVCQELFEQRCEMILHMKTLHTKQAYKCKSCSKAFDTNIARNKHEKRSHVDPALRPHKCEFCEKTFCRSDLWKEHKRTHTGEKPFVCERCGTAFKQIHHLKVHLKSMTYSKCTIGLNRPKKKRNSIKAKIK